MKVRLKIRNRGKRGYDISSVPFKKLEKASKSARLKNTIKHVKNTLNSKV